jgi:hypothetical protein
VGGLARASVQLVASHVLDLAAHFPDEAAGQKMDLHSAQVILQNDSAEYRPIPAQRILDGERSFLKNGYRSAKPQAAEKKQTVW